MFCSMLSSSSYPTPSTLLVQKEKLRPRDNRWGRGHSVCKHRSQDCEPGLLTPGSRLDHARHGHERFLGEP